MPSSTKSTPSLEAPIRASAIPTEIKEALIGFLEHLAYERRVSMATVLAYGGDLRLIFEEAARLGVRSLKAVSVTTINTVLSSAHWRDGRPLHPRSIGRRHTALRTFYAWATEHLESDILDITPWLITPPQVRKPPRPLLVPTALSLIEGRTQTTKPSDIAALTSAAVLKGASSLTALRDAAALLLLYGPGLMRQEALDLQLADVDLSNRWLKIRGRGRKAREVPIPTGCIEGLRAYVEARVGIDNPYFLAGRNKRPLGARTLLRIVARAAKELLGHHATPRQLRHSFATHLVADGARASDIQQMLGHSTAKATERYREVAISDLRAMMAQSHPRTRPQN